VIGLVAVGGMLVMSSTPVPSVAQTNHSLMGVVGVPEEEGYVPEYEPSVSSLDAVPGSEESIAGFSLVADDVGYVPSMSAEQQAAVQAVLDRYAPGNRTVGFVFVDLGTGSGFAYNADAEVYSASSIKAHLAVFACQDQVEGGRISLSSFKSNAENAVLWSDNDSYYRLRRASHGYGANNAFDAWVAGLGLDPSVSDGSFPRYSARESAKLWMNAYLYFQSGDPELTGWLKDMFSNTNVSMIRDGVGGAAASPAGELSFSGTLLSAPGWVETALLDSVRPECTVYNKAGWINGSSDNAVNDAGIIVAGDDAYLMSILTSAPDSAGNRQLVADLARSLWEARGALQPRV